MSLSFKVDTELTWAQGAESKFYRCRKEMDKRGVLSTWSPDRKEPQVLSGQRKENGVVVKNMSSGGFVVEY